MSEVLSTIRAAMLADAQALQTIAQNIANADVTAYRRQIPVARAQFASQLDALQASSTPLPTPETSSVVFDAQHGTLKATGEPLDLAIEGGGFFVLESPDGPLLTRRGDFHVSADGVLSAFSGHSVLGEAGAIQLPAGALQIDTDGALRVDGELVDRLQLWHPARESELTSLGNGLYAMAAAGVSIDGHASIHQGHLETSNVSAVNETVRMMETLRHFEAAQRFARGYDQMMEQAISELGKVD